LTCESCTNRAKLIWEMGRLWFELYARMGRIETVWMNDSDNDKFVSPDNLAKLDNFIRNKEDMHIIIKLPFLGMNNIVYENGNVFWYQSSENNYTKEIPSAQSEYCSNEQLNSLVYGLYNSSLAKRLW